MRDTRPEHELLDISDPPSFTELRDEFRRLVDGMIDIESELREQAIGSQDGYLLAMADRMRKLLA